MTFESKPASRADAPPAGTEPPALKKPVPRKLPAFGPEPEPSVDPALASFFDDIEAAYRKHGLSLGHEDVHGAFTVEPLTEENIEWLRAAHDDREPRQ